MRQVRKADLGVSFSEAPGLSERERVISFPRLLRKPAFETVAPRTMAAHGRREREAARSRAGLGR
jgi:hypothetical protein